MIRYMRSFCVTSHSAQQRNYGIKSVDLFIAMNVPSVTAVHAGFAQLARANFDLVLLGQQESYIKFIKFSKIFTVRLIWKRRSTPRKSVRAAFT